jgi:hypothetical protein
MSLGLFVYDRWRRVLAAGQKRRVLKQAGPPTFDRAGWSRSMDAPTQFYLDCFRYFHRHLPEQLRQHRAYFSRKRRGFGEDAMHVEWFLLFRELRPASFLEIGVYRGQVLSLATMLASLNDAPCFVQGISPFSSAGDSVTEYLGNLDYFEDTLEHFRRFSLPIPSLLKAFSTDAEAAVLIRSRSWDLIYIDGNHDYPVVRKDWEVCSECLRVGGVIVLDDASLDTAFRPPLFATGGHPGPSRLAKEIDRRQFREILQVGHNRAFQKLV